MILKYSDITASRVVVSVTSCRVSRYSLVSAVPAITDNASASVLYPTHDESKKKYQKNHFIFIAVTNVCINYYILEWKHKLPLVVRHGSAQCYVQLPLTYVYVMNHNL